MSVGLRRHLLCFATGALIALAAVLLIREGRDRKPEAAAQGTPARVSTTRTTAARTPRSVRLRTKHASPGQGRRKDAARGASASGRGGPSRAGDAATRGTGGTRAGGASSAAGATPRARPSRTTPEQPDEAAAGSTAGDPTTEDPSAPGGDDDGGQASDPAAPAAADGGAGDPSSAAAGAGAGVTIPNPATPDASVGG